MKKQLEIEPVRPDEITEAASAFGINNSRYTWNQIGKGLIHQTFRSYLDNEVQNDAYILQIINTIVFPNPEQVMQNIRLVAAHLEQKDYPKKILKPLITENGKSMYAGGRHVWRAYPYISNSMTMDNASSADTAYEIAYTFGEYLHNLNDLDPLKLAVAIPGFHHTPQRYEQLKRSAEAASERRLKNALKTLQKAEEYTYLLRYFPALQNHIRVTHGDTKVNNILLDATSQAPLCVIDLDTLMPGMVSYDFGDMVRTITPAVNEDHEELSEVIIRKEYHNALTDGFLTSIKNSITSSEREGLNYGSALIIFEQAIRFLTDYLENDRYYPVDKAEHNLVRCQNQLVLLKEYLLLTRLKK